MMEQNGDLIILHISKNDTCTEHNKENITKACKYYMSRTLSNREEGGNIREKSAGRQGDEMANCTIF